MYKFFAQILKNISGCDSIVTLHLTINTGTHDASTETACNSFEWNGTTYTASGTYTFDYTNLSGCASTDTLHLTINHGTHNSITIVACVSYVWNDKTYSESGVYINTYNNQSGCPSADTLHLTINPLPVVHVTALENWFTLICPPRNNRAFPFFRKIGGGGM